MFSNLKLKNFNDLIRWRHTRYQSWRAQPNPKLCCWNFSIYMFKSEIFKTRIIEVNTNDNILYLVTAESVVRWLGGPMRDKRL
jgi:hypothetical protein